MAIVSYIKSVLIFSQWVYIALHFLTPVLCALSVLEINVRNIVNPALWMPRFLYITSFYCTHFGLIYVFFLSLEGKSIYREIKYDSCSGKFLLSVHYFLHKSYIFNQYNITCCLVLGITDCSTGNNTYVKPITCIAPVY